MGFIEKTRSERLGAEIRRGIKKEEEEVAYSFQRGKITGAVAEFVVFILKR